MVNDLYFQKKKLLIETPFEWNISMTLWILVAFVVGLVFFTHFGTF